MADGSSLFGRLIRGAVAGAVATWVMDLTTTGLMSGQSPSEAAREKAAQKHGKSSVENMIDAATGFVGLQLTGETRSMAAYATHYALGVVPGALYSALRPAIPAIGAGRGLLFGLGLFLVNDEFLNTALGFAGPPEAYPVATHVRGLVGHAVLGVMTDATIDILGG